MSSGIELHTGAYERRSGALSDGLPIIGAGVSFVFGRGWGQNSKMVAVSFAGDA
jgi:hypothetical protein